MPHPPQTFENHSKVPVSIIVNSVVLLVAALAAAAGVVMAITGAEGLLPLILIGCGAIVTALATISVALMARTYALTLQDRIIRLEMQVRFARLLPPELLQRAGTLSISHLVALRFASDAELAELVAQVLDQGMSDRKAIKKLIRNWQADHQRV